MTATHEPCTTCEKPVRVDRPHWRVHILEGDIDLGWHIIGPECRKAHPTAERWEAIGPLADAERRSRTTTWHSHRMEEDR